MLLLQFDTASTDFLYNRGSFWRLQSWCGNVSRPRVTTAYLHELCVPAAGIFGLDLHGLDVPNCREYRRQSGSEVLYSTDPQCVTVWHLFCATISLNTIRRRLKTYGFEHWWIPSGAVVAFLDFRDSRIVHKCHVLLLSYGSKLATTALDDVHHSQRRHVLSCRLNVCLLRCCAERQQWI